MTADELRAKIAYNQETGLFVWRVSPRRGVVAGAPAGNKSVHGYLDIRLHRRLYRAHRMAWLHVTGEWPKAQIDHINGDRLDNRFSNLREASNAENARNKGLQKNNVSGVRGVSWHKAAGKWQVKICTNFQQKYLGLFDDLEAAKRVRAQAALNEHKDFARVQ